MIDRVIEYTVELDDEDKLLIGWATESDRPVLARAPIILDQADILRMVGIVLALGAVAAMPVSLGMFWLLNWLGA